jgi:hypothetical protein
VVQQDLARFGPTHEARFGTDSPERKKVEHQQKQWAKDNPLLALAEVGQVEDRPGQGAGEESGSPPPLRRPASLPALSQTASGGKRVRC